MGVLEVMAKLKHGAFNIAVLLLSGGSSPELHPLLFFIKNWIEHSGGLFLIKGKGIDLKFFFDVIEVDWSQDIYRRYKHSHGPAIDYLPNKKMFLKAAPKFNNAKAITISVPQKKHQIFIETEANVCSIATTPLGQNDGAVVFFGDVSAEKSTMNSLVALCLGYGRPPPCAKCRKIETDDSKLSRCSRCGVTHYCSKTCQKQHWKKHKKVCSTTNGLSAVDRSIDRNDEAPLKVIIPPNVAREAALEDHIEMLLQQRLSQDLHRMGVRKDAQGNFINPISGQTVPDLS